MKLELIAFLFAVVVFVAANKTQDPQHDIQIIRKFNFQI